MWFKQIQLFSLNKDFNYKLEDLLEKLGQLKFRDCLPSLPSSMGWIVPLEEKDAPLAQVVNGCIMICLQIEEKILPATVVRQELNERIKQIENEQDRKVRQKEKLALKDEMTITLLSQAFSKLIKVYAYIDTKNHWLVLGTNSEKRTEQFLECFKKSVSEKINPLSLEKLSPIMTDWLNSKNYPTSIAIEKNCVFQDPNQQNRIIRCQQQDLFANGIQSLIKDGCQVKQIALCWEDRVVFVLTEDFSLQSIRFQEEITMQVTEMEAETQQQKFTADFLIMAETFSRLLQELLSLFSKTTKQAEKKVLEVTL